MSTPHCCVIGAGPGIGAAVAEAFATEGCDLTLISRRAEGLVPLAEDLRRRTRRRVQTLVADATRPESLRETLATATEVLGPIEVLVYNVATSTLGRPTRLSPEALVHDFQGNVVGALTAAQCVAPEMRDRRRGSILFTGGGFAYEPSADYASLSLGKAALRSLTQTLAQELGAYGVHVATVTVYGFIQSGTHFDPQRIARHYLELHRQPRGHFETEKIYK